MCPSKPRPRMVTTACANGPDLKAPVTKDLLVGANWCAGQHDPDAPPGSPRALSHRASEVVCSRRMLPRPTRAPAARSARAPIMLPGLAQTFGEMFPVTRELQLVSMSVGPRYSRAVLVK